MTLPGKDWRDPYSGLTLAEMEERTRARRDAQLCGVKAPEPVQNIKKPSGGSIVWFAAAGLKFDRVRLLNSNVGDVVVAYYFGVYRRQPAPKPEESK